MEKIDTVIEFFSFRLSKRKNEDSSNTCTIGAQGNLCYIGTDGIEQTLTTQIRRLPLFGIFVKNFSFLDL